MQPDAVTEAAGHLGARHLRSDSSCLTNSFLYPKWKKVEWVGVDKWQISWLKNEHKEERAREIEMDKSVERTVTVPSRRNVQD